MKTKLTFAIILLSVFCSGQDNKPVAGDFGIRYGVSFNGTATQGLTFSGMATNRIEVGCAINVQYSATKTSSSGTQNIYSDSLPGAYETGTETTASTTRTISAGISPFVVYHFPIKTNLDVYTGGRITVGPSSHTISTVQDSKTTGYNYFNEVTTTYGYPWGYAAGAGLIIGGQYFFYKRLAIGVEGNLGALYNNTHGHTSVEYVNTNNGIYNNSSINSITYSHLPYSAHSFSLTTASSIGINLTFYVSRKAKVKKEGPKL